MGVVDPKSTAMSLDLVSPYCQTLELSNEVLAQRAAELQAVKV